MKTALMATVVLALASPSFAGQPAQAGPAASDRTFVVNTLKSGMAEVELGKLARDNAGSDQVKQFAQRMVDDHGKAGDELKAIAQKMNITVPTDIDPQDKALRDTMAKLRGEAFDREYMRMMVSGHRTVLEDFRAESTSGMDADVKAWAAKTMATVEDHLKQAEATNKAVGTSGKQ